MSNRPPAPRHGSSAGRLRVSPGTPIVSWRAIRRPDTLGKRPLFRPELRRPAVALLLHLALHLDGALSHVPLPRWCPSPLPSSAMPGPRPESPLSRRPWAENELPSPCVGLCGSSAAGRVRTFAKIASARTGDPMGPSRKARGQDFGRRALRPGRNGAWTRSSRSSDRVDRAGFGSSTSSCTNIGECRACPHQDVEIWREREQGPLLHDRRREASHVWARTWVGLRLGKLRRGTCGGKPRQTGPGHGCRALSPSGVRKTRLACRSVPGLDGARDLYVWVGGCPAEWGHRVSTQGKRPAAILVRPVWLPWRVSTVLPLAVPRVPGRQPRLPGDPQLSPRTGDGPGHPQRQR